MANKNSNSEQKGHPYTGSPTLETLVVSSTNAKNTAHEGSIEYSNFLKVCKMEKDIRLSTYQKCAAGLGMAVLIVYLPSGIIERHTNLKPHIDNRYETIKQDELIRFFRELMLDGRMRIDELMIEFINNLNKDERDHLMKPFLSAIVELC